MLSTILRIEQDRRPPALGAIVSQIGLAKEIIRTHSMQAGEPEVPRRLPDKDGGLGEYFTGRKSIFAHMSQWREKRSDDQ
jgi:hypothetical protein